MEPDGRSCRHAQPARPCRGVRRAGPPRWRCARGGLLTTLLVVASLSTLFGATPGRAAGGDAETTGHFGPYVGLAAGPSGMLERDGRLVTRTGSSINGRVQYQDGSMVELSLGLRLNRHLRVEASTAYRRYEIQDISLGPHDGDLQTVTGMLNGIAEWPMGEWNGLPTFVPYLGAGVGLLWAKPDAELYTDRAPLLEVEGSSVEFAWNVQVGFEIPITRWLGLRMGYRYLEALDSSWNARLGGVSVGDVDQTMRAHEGRFGLRFGY